MARNCIAPLLRRIVPRRGPWRRSARWPSVFAAVLALLAQPLDGQMVGLALSGGSARGLAHIGVIQVLEEEGIPVHVVTGTSMGALVGSLYALGLPADSLVAVAERFNEGDLFSDRVPRRYLSPDQRLFDERTVVSLPLGPGGVRLPEGVLEGTRLTRALERELWAGQGVGSFHTLPRRFRALAVDLRSGRPVALDSGGLAEAVRASIAIPGLLQPVEVDSLLLVDGGLVRNLPARDAEELGAEFLICSDVSRPLEAEEYESLVEVVARGMTLTTQEELQEERAGCDILLRPVSLELTAADYDALDTWLRLGREAARAALPELRRRLDQPATEGRDAAVAYDGAGATEAAELLPDTVEVRTVRFLGLDGEAMARSAQRALGIRPGDRVDAQRMDEALSALQATRLFRDVGYEIHRGLSGFELQVSLTPQPQEKVGVGVRYDDRYQASILLSATLLNRLGYGASTRVDLRMGEEFQLQTTHFTGRGITSSQGFGLLAGAVRVPLRLRNGTSTDEIWASVVSFGGLLTLAEQNGGVAGLELRQEWVWEDAEGDFPAVPPGDVAPGDRSYRSLTLLGIRDTFDDAAFPMRGGYLSVRSEWADRKAGSEATFRQHLADLRLAVPLTSHLALRGGLFAGLASGPDLPLHKHFFLGGTVTSAVFTASQPRLLGFTTQDRWGRVAQASRLALQWAVTEGVFLTGTVNAGHTRDRWGLDLDAWTAGWGVELGARTLFGPVRLTVAGQRSPSDTRVDLEIGRRF